MIADASWLAPVMFVSMAGLLLLGFPVALTLMAHGFAFLLVGIQLGAFEPAFVGAIPLRIYGITFNELLLAIPLFTFMGMVMERSGLAEDLLDTVGRLFGPVPGGLAYAVIGVGALLAATTGLVQASVIAMGLISLPAMLQARYSPAVASGVITASASLAQIIPPSLVLIVFAEVMGLSIGELYAAAWLPGVTLALLYALFVFGLTRYDPALLPPVVLKREPLRPLLRRVAVSLVPPLLLIAVTLGSMFAGFATPTEAGAYGSVGALVICAVRRRLTVALVRQASDATVLLSCCAVFILVGATCFTLPFRGLDGHLWIESLFRGLPGAEIGFLIVANLLVFVLAFFLDFFEIAFIVLPLLTPVALALKIDLVWFAVLLCVNMQTSFLHPPFGMALYNLRSVAPASVSTRAIYLGAIPFIVIQIIMVGLLIAFPVLTRPFGVRVSVIGPPVEMTLPPIVWPTPPDIR
jgi:tripartite ATP-independent transporter DctM subunit